MAEADHPHFVLVGGGLAGGLLAAYLGRRGYEVDLYERRPDPSSGQFVGGRSINLALSVRGIHALRLVGLDEAVLSEAIPMRGRMIHDRAGGLHYQPYDKDPANCINSIGRAALNRITLAAARQHPRVRVHFEHHCTGVDLDGPRATLVKGNDSTPIEAPGDILIGVDGAFSVVRRAMQRLDRFDYSQQFLRHGYKELAIGPEEGGGWRLEKHALHIWPRRRFMMIALPNPDGSFTCTLFYPIEGPESFAAIGSDDDVLRFFEREFPDALSLMPDVAEQFHTHPTGSMVTVRCGPWHVGGKVALLGDAAHAVVPFYGQGMNAAFEDCVVLDECIARLAPDWRRVFEAYDAARRPNTDALAELAIENFREMRDKTASRSFHWYKRMERTLHRALPGGYTPLYTMVSFTTIPYAEAVRRAGRQDRWTAIFAAMMVFAALSCLLRWTTGERWVACVSISAVLVGAVVQWLITRAGRSTKASSDSKPTDRGPWASGASESPAYPR